MSEVRSTGYQGACVPPGSLGGELAGEIQVDPEGIRFQSGPDVWAIPFARLTIDLASRNRVRFTDPSQAELAIYTREDRMLAHPIFRQQANLSARATQIRGSLEKRTLVKLAVGLVAGFIGLVVCGWALMLLAANLLIQRVPPSWESELSRVALRQIEPKLKPANHPAWDREIAAIARRLTNAMPASPYVFQLQIIDDPTPNAFALPGGRIFIHSGLLKTAPSAEEVAGVVAHEMAHVNLRHGLRQMIKASTPRLLLRVFVGDQQGFLTLASEGSQLLLQQHYSRDAEREADQTGWQYLLAAKIDPRGMIAFFQALEKDPKFAGGDSAALRAFSSHPMTRERIGYLESLWETSPRKTGFEPIVVPNL